MKTDAPTLVQSAQPRFLEGDNKTAVLLFHGWTGYPGQHYFLAEALNRAGYSVSVPRLPGHGTTTADFLSSRAVDWVRRAEDAYMEMLIRYPKTVPVGVSMGALLALHIGARWNVPGIAAAAPAVVLNNPFAHLAPYIQPFIRKIPLEQIEEKETDDPDELYIREHYWSARYPSSVAQFLKVRKTVLRELPSIEAPLFIIETEQDEMVTLKSGKYIQKNCRSNKIDHLLLHESKHQVFNGMERQTVADALIAWLAKIE